VERTGRQQRTVVHNCAGPPLNRNVSRGWDSYGKSGLWRKRPKLLCHLSEKMVIFHPEFIVPLCEQPEFFSTMRRRMAHFGASVFWLRRLAALGGEEQAIAGWQMKRDGTRRGIIEIIKGQT
jgi:hypothetical protein